VIAAVVAVIALALVLDRQAPHRAPPRRPVVAMLTAADVSRIERRVERLRDLRFTHPVKPLFVRRGVAVRMQAAETAKDYPPSRRQAAEESLKLLGLLRPTDSLAGAESAIEREQVLGFYDPKRNRLVVIRDRSASRPLLEITLAHELVHALEDQRFGLRENADPSDDAGLAESALAEGTATTVMAEYAVRYFGIGDALALFDSADSGTKLPAYVDDALLFPYEQGVEFVAAFRGASGSWRALDKVIRLRPPATAEQVIHPAKYAIGEVPARIELPDVAAVLGAGWHRVATTSVGEFDLREIFKILGGSPNRRAAAGWNGGRFELWRRDGAQSCAAPCVARDVGLMSLAWDTMRDRGEGERALATAFERGLGARRASDRRSLRTWSSRGGIIALRGTGRRTTVVIAPDRQIAARILAFNASGAGRADRPEHA
jgi:hypothetical protein